MNFWLHFKHKFPVCHEISLTSRSKRRSMHFLRLSLADVANLSGLVRETFTHFRASLNKIKQYGK